MEVVESSSAILCNSEVLQFLREQREKNLQKINQYRKDNKGGQAATVILETLTHLDKSPCADLKPESFAGFSDKLLEIGISLTSAEKLHILNHCPTVSKTLINNILNNPHIPKIIMDRQKKEGNDMR